MKNVTMGRFGGFTHGLFESSSLHRALHFKKSSSWRVLVQDLAVHKKRNTTDAGLKPSSMPLSYNSKRTVPHLGGFPLIELLVVVLIIGILAAIALPQYQVAVAKSRLSGMITLANSIARAERVYYLANGKYTVDADDLDIQLPGDFTKKNLLTNYSNYASSSMVVHLYINNEGGAPRVVVYSTLLPSFVLASFEPNKNYLCGVLQTDAQVELGKKICATYGVPKKAEGSGYFYYELK